MTTPRLTLPSTLALALTACAPGDGGEDKRAPGPPIGFELAVAQPFDATPEAPEAQETRVIDLTPQQLREKLASGNIRLIDVRRADEVAEGIIPGAEHIALDQFDPATLDLSDGREVVLYCRSGRRSGIAGEALAAHTGEPAQHLAGGIIAWEASEQELSTGRE